MLSCDTVLVRMEIEAKKLTQFLFGVLAIVVISVLSFAEVNGGLQQKNAVRVWVFDIGQGDAIFIDAPNAQILIDGGPGNAILEKLSRVMLPWDKQIDAIINTHPHADHVTGLLAVLERYQVEHIFDSGQQYGTDVFLAFDEGYNPNMLISGSVFDLGGGAVLRVLYPDAVPEKALKDPNAGSVVMMLEYGQTTMLLTGDIGIYEERLLLERIEDIDVLKVAHQGSRTSSDLEFLQKANPEHAVISVGKNSYGHPHSDVVERLQAIGATIWRTDWHSDVRILMDEENVAVRGFEL